MSGYIIPLDPNELANRFPAYDPRDEEDDFEGDFFDDVSSEEIAEIFAEDDYEERVAPILDRLPERESDLLDMYFFKKKRQAEIAGIFGVTQAAISYRLDRGIKRLKFLLSIPQVTEEELREGLPSVFSDPIDVDILVGMWQTTCQSEVANILKLTQGRVRHRFFKAVLVLQEAVQGDDVSDVVRSAEVIFSAISSKNFNVLREVKLPQWGDRGNDACI